MSSATLDGMSMKLISSEKLIETPVFTVSQDVAKDPQGFEIKRAIVHHIGSAVMMAVDAKRRVLLVKQYRLPAQQYMWELPAGRLDPGETPLKAAKRELIEETGYRAKTWTKLATFYASPGFLNEKMNLFLAEGLIEGEKQEMEDERIEMRWFTSKEMDEMLATGKLLDAKTMVGYLLWRRRKPVK